VQVTLSERGRAIIDGDVPARVRGLGTYTGMRELRDRI
jgi:hypothetical protein